MSYEGSGRGGIHGTGRRCSNGMGLEKDLEQDETGAGSGQSGELKRRI